MFEFRLLLLFRFVTLPAQGHLADEPDRGQRTCREKIPQVGSLAGLGSHQSADAHSLPVVMESFAAIEANYIHILWRRLTPARRTLGKARAPMPAAEAQVREPID